MGMSTHVVGFRPPDDTWKAMKAAYDACLAAQVKVPEAVLKFFNYEPPDPAGVEVQIGVREFQANGEHGFEVDIDQLPANITVIRFVNSW